MANPEPPIDNTKAPLRWLLSRLMNLHEAGVLVTIALVVFGWFGRFHFLADLASHFRVQAICALLYGGIVLLLFRRKLFGALGFGVGIALLLTLVPFYMPQSHVDIDPDFRFMVMNVLTRNQSKQAVIDYIQETSPDVFILLETDDRWSGAIRGSLMDEWPYQTHQSRSDNFGLLLCSKRKPTSERISYYGSDQLPTVEAVVKQADGREVRFIGTHPLPPMNQRNWRSRNAQLQAVAESIQQSDLQGTTILAGDLNCSPWSPFFSELMSESGLRDSACGFGLRPTWYVTKFFLTALPIDHVLYGDDLVIQNRAVGPALGSDHRAVMVDVSIKQR